VERTDRVIVAHEVDTVVACAAQVERAILPEPEDVFRRSRPSRRSDPRPAVDRRRDPPRPDALRAGLIPDRPSECAFSMISKNRFNAQIDQEKWYDVVTAAACEDMVSEAHRPGLPGEGLRASMELRRSVELRRS
jgi:hypothetical protein